MKLLEGSPFCMAQLSGVVYTCGGVAPFCTVKKTFYFPHRKSRYIHHHRNRVLHGDELRRVQRHDDN